MTVSTFGYADFISGSASSYESYKQANPNFSSDSMSQVTFGTGVATALAAIFSYAESAPFLKGLSQGVAPEVAFADFGVNIAAYNNATTSAERLSASLGVVGSLAGGVAAYLPTSPVKAFLTGIATGVVAAQIAITDNSEDVSSYIDGVLNSVFDFASNPTLEKAVEWADQFWVADIGHWIGQNLPTPYDINKSVSDLFNGAHRWIQRCDPLTLDLDGDGLETVGIDTGRLVYFDHNGDGVKTATGWVGSDDGFLVLDRNGNGSIDSGAELFGDSTALADGSTATDGFAALAEQDTNGDGVVNQNDSGWGDLRIWRDLNQNGISEAGELQSLDDIGIASLDVGAQSHSQVLADGNRLADLGRFTWATGEVGEIESTTGQSGDIDLAENSFYRQFTDPVPLTAEAESLPEMHGSGALRDMREAASLSPDLLPKRHIMSRVPLREEFGGLGNRWTAEARRAWKPARIVFSSLVPIIHV